MRSKALEIETGDGNSVLAALTEQVAYLMAALETRNISSGNQRNKEGHQNRVKGPGIQGPGINKRNGAHKNNGDICNQNPMQGNRRAGGQVQFF